MSKILERDVSGKCDNCEDLVKKCEKERQKKSKSPGWKGLVSIPTLLERNQEMRHQGPWAEKFSTLRTEASFRHTVGERV
jgi:hypothetical protein